VGSLEDALVLPTSSGVLIVGYDDSISAPIASISAVPEPTSLVYFAEATLLGLGILAYRRRQAIAVV
jgi:hypothetical protein